MKAHAQPLVAARLSLALLTLLLVSAIVFPITGLLLGDAAQQVLTGRKAAP
jgi:peptide/nickel transport system permease protein